MRDSRVRRARSEHAARQPPQPWPSRSTLPPSAPTAPGGCREALSASFRLLARSLAPLGDQLFERSEGFMIVVADRFDEKRKNRSQLGGPATEYRFERIAGQPRHQRIAGV